MTLVQQVFDVPVGANDSPAKRLLRVITGYARAWKQTALHDAATDPAFEENAKPVGGRVITVVGCFTSGKHDRARVELGIDLIKVVLGSTVLWSGSLSSAIWQRVLAGDNAGAKVAFAREASAAIKLGDLPPAAPMVVPPADGWEANTLYLVQVACRRGNPIHESYLKVGFLLEDGAPGNYTEIWNNTYDVPLKLRDLHYLRVTQKLHSKGQ